MHGALPAALEESRDKPMGGRYYVASRCRCLSSRSNVRLSSSISSPSFSESISLLAFSASSRQSRDCGVMEVPFFLFQFPHKVLWIPEVSLSNFEQLVVENHIEK